MGDFEGEVFMNLTNQLPFVRILPSKYFLKTLVKIRLFNFKHVKKYNGQVMQADIWLKHHR